MSAAVLLLTLGALLALALATVRLVRGPGHADRVVALDIFLAGAVVLAVAAALHSGRTEFLDVAIGLALVGFVGTASLARLVEQGGRYGAGGAANVAPSGARAESTAAAGDQAAGAGRRAGAQEESK